MKLNFKKNVTFDVSRSNPNMLVETSNINHFTIAMGLVRAIEKDKDTRVLMYYPTESEDWNDVYSDFFHTVPNVNCEVSQQISFDDFVEALIEIGTFRWANICDIPKNIVVIIPYAERVLADADMEQLEVLAQNCSSVGVHLIFISDWEQSVVDFSKLNVENQFITVGKPTLTSLQIEESKIGENCSFDGREVQADEGSVPYTVHLFIDVSEE